MTDETTNLVLEQLRLIRASIDQIARDVSDIKIRLTILEGHVAALVLSDLRQTSRMDHFDERLQRVERRLELIP